jgi:hypothetical protein
MKPLITHLTWHLGDNMLFLHWLRRVAKANPDRQFIHYHDQEFTLPLREMVTDVPNIKLQEYFGPFMPRNSEDVWINSGGFFDRYPYRNDFVRFYLDWYEALAKRLRVENSIKTRENMLFDYPAIQRHDRFKPFDVLIINARPGSGQFASYNETRLIIMAERMADRGLKVWITSPLPPHAKNPNLRTTKPNTGWLSCAEIGALSLKCPTIVMVSTGPTWPTFNIWNTESVKNRIILLDNQRVWLQPNGTRHFRSVPDSEIYLHKIGLL